MCCVLFKSTLEQVWKVGWEGERLEAGKPVHVIVAHVSDRVLWGELGEHRLIESS